MCVMKADKEMRRRLLSQQPLVRTMQLPAYPSRGTLYPRGRQIHALWSSKPQWEADCAILPGHSSIQWETNRALGIRLKKKEGNPELAGAQYPSVYRILVHKFSIRIR